ncbi:prevent-host-death protein [Paraburkholderia silviterrae]|uniref:Prevent-host-death protein n=1 Tax=Paraburkholderia silviterrae TaxID=2528715 RepID=A0A4R5M0N5_9BURK|nr:prevent-host-death protein [Paraburkholderia silviterrae]TDG18728.1 prevent-host-death protein [Paraburkholderia silviterrae]
METLIPQASVDIEDLKTCLEAIVASADRPVAILQDSKPVALLVSVGLWDTLCETLEDIELCHLVKTRQNDPVVAVKLSDL